MYSGDRLSTLLGSLHCDPDKDLESDAAIFSKALHKTAVELNVSKPTLPCCLAAITNLQERSYKVESELDAATDQVEKLKSVRDKLEAMKCHIEKLSPFTYLFINTRNGRQYQGTLQFARWNKSKAHIKEKRIQKKNSRKFFSEAQTQIYMILCGI